MTLTQRIETVKEIISAWQRFQKLLEAGALDGARCYVVEADRLRAAAGDALTKPLDPSERRS